MEIPQCGIGFPERGERPRSQWGTTMRTPFRLALLATASVVAFATAALAEENLGTMTISANRTATDVARSGSSVTVITAEEIEKKQAVTALDVIRDVPGVNLASNGGIGKSSSLSIRGIGAKGILILVDGIKVADPSNLDRTYDLTNLLADNIERIEVLRGNQSTLYGSSAVGGVITITTKTGKGSGKIATGETGVEWGSHGTGKTYVNARGEVGGVYYGGSVSGFTTQGIDIARGGPDEEDGYKNGSANLKIGADLLADRGILDRLNVEAVGRYLKAQNEYDDFPWPTNASVDADLEQRTIESSGRLTTNVDLFDGLLANNFNVGQSRTRRDYYADGERDTFYDGEITKYEYQGTLKPVDNHTFVFGTDREREHMKSSYSSPSSATNDGIFGNYILDLLNDDLTLTAGLRHDDHETFGGHTTWRTTAAYRIPETGTRFHASYGTAFRAPTLYQIFDPTYGNTDLKPEKSRGYDLGFEQSVWNDRVTFGSTFFNTRTQNAINFSSSSTYENISSARSFGFENSLNAEISDELSLTVGYTYLQARDNSTGNTISNAPHHAGNARLNYAPSEVSGLGTWVAARTATWSYDSGSSTEYTGGYLVWDLGASYTINDWASVYGRLENIADKTYETKGGYAEGGRAGFVGFRAKF